MNTEGSGFYTCKECHKTESLYNHTATVHKEREQLGDRRKVGESSCNSGDGPILDVYDDDDDDEDDDYKEKPVTTMGRRLSHLF
jgi:hypothetical protein